MKQKPSVPATPVDPGATLELSIKDRLTLPNLLPEQSNLLEMKIMRSIERKIEIQAQELIAVNYHDVIDQEGKPTGRVEWDPKKDKPFKAHLSGIEISLLKKYVNRLSQENKIPKNCADIAIKIDEAKIGE